MDSWEDPPTFPIIIHKKEDKILRILSVFTTTLWLCFYFFDGCR